MAAYGIKPTKPGLEEPQEQIHKIRITLSSKNVKNLEKGNFFVCILQSNHTHMIIILFRIMMLYYQIIAMLQ